jgi:hypothetical protein
MMIQYNTEYNWNEHHLDVKKIHLFKPPLLRCRCINLMKETLRNESKNSDFMNRLLIILYHACMY